MQYELWQKRRLIIYVSCISIAFLIVMFHSWLHVTNPYAHTSVVQQPYTTTVEASGDIWVTKQFQLATYNNPLAEGIGYYKSGFLIAQNTYFGSRPAPSNTADDIINDIHTLRFDPSKPYLISGDQFSVLYPRNLGVFYNSLLDPHTAHDQKDWENRQRIYLQSALYALDAFSSTNSLTTTIVPIGARSALLTEVHPGSIPSDSLYGLLYALYALQSASYNETPYRLQTATVTRAIVRMRLHDLEKLLNIYLRQVYDPTTGLVRNHLDLASARDGVVRDRSFYDNVILWKTIDLAQQLGIPTPPINLKTLRSTIMTQYWDDSEGHFRDDLSSRPTNSNYSSDWLIALPTGFLHPDNPDDQKYLTRTVDFIRRQGIAKPFPIKYQANNSQVSAPWAVRTFVPNYGGDAIWSYWGAQYMTLLAQLTTATHDGSYRLEALTDVKIYNQKIEQYRGFPETFDAKGDFLQNAIYKSIRQTGWVVQFEKAKYLLKSGHD